MSQHELLNTHPSDSSMTVGNPCPSIPSDVSSTFVKPLHDGASQSPSPYTFSAGTAIPPPPPELYPPLLPQPKRNQVHLIAITVLAVLVMLLGSLEVVQLAAHTLLTTYPSGSTGSNQAGISPAQHTTSPFKPAPIPTLTAGTIKENMTLTCSGCNDPVHTTINSITIDTTHLRLIWNITLNNESGAQQIDYFAAFSLQDPLGNTYEGTGNLNTDFFLRAGQMVFKTEIFSFLPRPGVSYILVARFGISGITYDPLQFTF
jgi:hypothetical protein